VSSAEACWQYKQYSKYRCISRYRTQCQKAVLSEKGTVRLLLLLYPELHV
jgi:hypothetical protein